MENTSCDCNAAEEEHEHCKGCDCILRWDESQFYCRWCEERMITTQKQGIS